MKGRTAQQPAPNISFIRPVKLHRMYTDSMAIYTFIFSPKGHLRPSSQIIDYIQFIGWLLPSPMLSMLSMLN